MFKLELRTGNDIALGTAANLNQNTEAAAANSKLPDEISSNIFRD